MSELLCHGPLTSRYNTEESDFLSLPTWGRNGTPVRLSSLLDGILTDLILCE